MTGSHEGDDQPHLSIHYDASGDEGLEAPGYAPAPVPLLQRYRYRLYAAVAFLAICAVGYGFGAATYDPPSRLPALVFAGGDGFYGTNAAVAAEQDVLRETFGQPGAIELRPAGTVYELPLPRSVADRLFGERDEAAWIFRAVSPAGDFKFLVLTEGNDLRVVAAEGPFGLGRLDQPSGVFLALDPADPAFEPVFEAMDGLLPELEALDPVPLSPDDVYIFGPYQAADAASLKERVEGNDVLSHLAGAIEEAKGGVSVAAPVFLVAAGPSRGTINAVYHPARRVVMEPLWGESSTASLGHELVHAYMDTVEDEREDTLTNAASYLEFAHPVLHGEVVSDLYQRLSREGRAEESLAFITGAVAAGQTKTVASQLLLENPGNIQISEAILYSDIGLLVQIGLLPPCMLPNEGVDGEIGPDFYERARVSCEE